MISSILLTSDLLPQSIGLLILDLWLIALLIKHKQDQHDEARQIETYRTLVGQFPNGAIMVFDQQLTCLVAGGHALPQLCRANHNPTRRTIHTSRLHPEIMAQLDNFCHAALEGETRSCEVIVEGRHYASQILPVYGNNRRVIACLVVFQDNTRCWVALQDAIHAQEAADVARQTKSAFLTITSHELRNPLNTILDNIELLQKQVLGALGPHQKAVLDQISLGSRQLLGLSENMLDLAKIEAGQEALDLKPIDVCQVCQQSLGLVRTQAIAKQIRITLSMDASITTIQADERRLSQILANLLSAAIGYTPKGGKISLVVKGDTTTQAVRFSVQDPGSGVSNSDPPRLGQPFVQPDSQPESSECGSKLSLTLVRQLVKLHGGYMDVSSSPGQGNCATVTLPWTWHQQQTSPEARRLPTFEVVSGESDIASTSILLVDDDTVGRQVVAHYLQAHHFRVYESPDAASALAELDRVVPDLIVMDIQMPHMDGLEAIRRIRAMSNGEDVPILALTALAMPGDRARCLAAGASAYLSKPVRLQTLLETLAELSNANRKLQTIRQNYAKVGGAIPRSARSAG
ncbi:MAG: response regulator [Oscillochloris sp.]|nr:response regulator [Oscillochloris sp.]